MQTLEQKNARRAREDQYRENGLRKKLRYILLKDKKGLDLEVARFALRQDGVLHFFKQLMASRVYGPGLENHFQPDNIQHFYKQYGESIVEMESRISLANFGVFSTTNSPEEDIAFFAFQLTAMDILEEVESELIEQGKISILDKVIDKGYLKGLKLGCDLER